MAEGDSILRLAERLRPVLLDQEIVTATAPNRRSGLQAQLRRIVGHRVGSIETRGKHLLFHLDDGLSIHSHLGMNGSWRVDHGRGFGRPEMQAWIILGLAEADQGRPSGATRVGQFRGPTLRITRTSELWRDPRLASLGPDILDPEFDSDLAADRLRASQDQVGVALLDQTVVCGIGNIFKSEACFAAKVDPWGSASSLAGSAAKSLLEVARTQMLSAVESGRRPNLIYRRAGRPCSGCRRAEIRSRAQGDDARTTYWCPRCQS